MVNIETLIEQLRRLRIYQRLKLEDELYPEYIDGLKRVMEQNNKECGPIEREYHIVNKKWANSSIYTEWLYNKDRERLYNLFGECKQKNANNIIEYEHTSIRNLKLKSFDIETEAIVLATICGKSLCTNEKIVPLIGTIKIEEPIE